MVGQLQIENEKLERDFKKSDYQLQETVDTNLNLASKMSDLDEQVKFLRHSQINQESAYKMHVLESKLP